jgi:hypothetical protein
MTYLSGPVDDLVRVFGAQNAEEIARTLIKKVKVETAYTPPYIIDDPFAPGEPNPFLEKIRPKVTLYTVQNRPVSIEPYGPPGETQWPKVKRNAAIAGAGVGLVTAWILYRAFLR